MKNLLTFIALFTSAFTLAQTTPIEVRIEKRLERLSDLILRERAHNTLSEEAKKQILEHINRSILTIQGTGQAQPEPTPVPLMIVAEGRIENLNFRFEAPHTGTIYNQCLDFVRNRLTQADDIIVSFNGKKYEVRRNQHSWWTGGEQMCKVIIDLATPQMLQPEPLQNIHLEGFIQQQNRIELVGHTFGEVFNKCVHFVESKFTQADRIEISLNGGMRRSSYNQASWWKGPFEICEVITKEVPRL